MGLNRSYNRKQRREAEKRENNHQNKTVTPFISLCESFASEYLSGSLQTDFNKDELYKTYNERWKKMAREIISKDPKTYYDPNKPEKTKQNRMNLIQGFERFAEKYMDKPSDFK